MEQSKQERIAEKLLDKEMRTMHLQKEKESAQKLRQAKNELHREFVRKKEMLLDKIQSMKSENRSIEDIYRYTNDIIFEEESEQTEHRDSDDLDILEEQISHVLADEINQNRHNDEFHDEYGTAARPQDRDQTQPYGRIEDKSPSFYKNSDALMLESTNKKINSQVNSFKTTPARQNVKHVVEAPI